MSPGDAGLSAELRAPIEEELGPLSKVQALPAGAQGKVWRAHADGQSLLIKAPDSAAAHRRELWAHRALDTALSTQLVPLLAASDRLLVYPWLGARSVEELDAGSDEELSAYRSAGAFVAAMRELPCDADDVPGEMRLAEALTKRFEAALLRTQGLVSDAELQRIEERWAAQAWSPSMRRRHAHRDFDASNWLVDETGALRVIDFGQSRPDYWLWDVVKLEADAFRVLPARREAFFEGLGVALSESESGELEALVLLHGLQTLGWAVEHGDEALEELARRILRER